MRKEYDIGMSKVPWDMKVGDMVQLIREGYANDHWQVADAIGLIIDSMECDEGLFYFEVQFADDRAWLEPYEIRLASET